MRDRTRQCLEDMLENTRRALRYFEENREHWRQDDLRTDAILRRVGVVGEAASRVPVADRVQFPSLCYTVLSASVGDSPAARLAG